MPKHLQLVPPAADGPRLRGRVLPGGGDWTLLRGDGVLELSFWNRMLAVGMGQVRADGPVHTIEELL
jgi:hypothetical protein